MFYFYLNLQLVRRELQMYIFRLTQMAVGLAQQYTKQFSPQSVLREERASSVRHIAPAAQLFICSSDPSYFSDEDLRRLWSK